MLLMIMVFQINARSYMYMEAHGSKDPLENHFEYLDLLVDALDARVIMPVYPKIPHRDYRTTFELLTKYISDY